MFSSLSSILAYIGPVMEVSYRSTAFLFMLKEIQVVQGRPHLLQHSA